MDNIYANNRKRNITAYIFSLVGFIASIVSILFYILLKMAWIDNPAIIILFFVLALIVIIIFASCVFSAIAYIVSTIILFKCLKETPNKRRNINIGLIVLNLLVLGIYLGLIIYLITKSILFNQ